MRKRRPRCGRSSLLCLLVKALRAIAPDGLFSKDAHSVGHHGYRWGFAIHPDAFFIHVASSARASATLSSVANTSNWTTCLPPTRTKAPSATYLVPSHAPREA